MRINVSQGFALSSGQVLSWGGDTGISRSAAATFRFGNGTANDLSGSLEASIYYLGTGSDGQWQSSVLRGRGDVGVVGFAPGSNAAAALDTGLSRGGAAATMALGNGAAGDATGTLKLKNVTTIPSVVSALTAAATAGAGARAFVTDSTQSFSAGVGTTVAGSGVNSVPVYSDGANWKIG